MASRWYIIHVYSGFEKKVRELIREQAEQKGLADQFEDILVPMEEVLEVRRGKKVAGERKFFPGYVLVKMDLTRRDLVAGTQHRQGHGLPRRRRQAAADPGPRGRAHHEPDEGGRRAPEAVDRLRHRRPGRVADGPFSSFSGVVERSWTTARAG